MQEANNYQSTTKVTSKIIIVIIAVVFVIVISGITIARNLKTPRVDSYKLKNLCTSEECLKQASRMLKNMDKSVDPCNNFYNFTCGNFMRYSKIPRDQTRLLVVLENTKIIQDELLNSYNSDPKLFIQPIREIQTFYQQCINSVHNESKSIASFTQTLLGLKWPILFTKWTEKRTFNWIDMETKFSIMGLAPVFLSTELKLDTRNFSAAYIGLDCTLRSLSKEMLNNSKILNEYEAVIQEFMNIIKKKYNMEHIKELLNFFLKVEDIKLTRVETSDANFYNSFQLINAGVLGEKLNFNLVKFLNSILPSFAVVTDDTLLGTNSYNCLINMTSMLRDADKRVVANYMIWTATHNLLWIISRKTRELDFRLNRIQTGIKASLPLNKLCLNFIDDHLPELSSAMYVKINYSSAKKKNLRTMVILLIKQLRKAINAATWMDYDTKQTAKEKVRRLSYVISYEDTLIRDKYLNSTYKNLIMTADILKNVRNIKRTTYTHMMETLHWSPKKRNKASLLPLAHVINAYYHPGLNTIAIPAGIAHGFIYSENQEAYLNFGSIGFIIGHELAHVFDNVGRLYDSNGRYINWWSDYSDKKFIEKSRCFVKQYDNFTLNGKLKINGTLTLGENMADAGGILLAYYAYLEWKEKYKVKKLPGFEKFTLEQLFWISVGNTWCDKLRPERLRIFLKTDVHSLGNFRVLGPLSNSKEFSKDFNCSIETYMNRKQKCTIW